MERTEIKTLAQRAHEYFDNSTEQSTIYQMMGFASCEVIEERDRILSIIDGMIKEYDKGLGIARTQYDEDKCRGADDALTQLKEKINEQS